MVFVELVLIIMLTLFTAIVFYNRGYEHGIKEMLEREDNDA